MPRELLPASPSRTSVGNLSGGVTTAKPLEYCPPVGPKYIDREGPGLRGGINHGNKGTQNG